MKEPNKGINWPTVGFGVSRYFTQPKFPDRQKVDWHKESTDTDRADISMTIAMHSFPHPKNKQINGNMLGLALGNEFILGKFLFGQQFGTYLLKPSTRPKDVYQRYSLVYRINKSLGVSLKTHAHVADFPDIRIGYSF